MTYAGIIESPSNTSDRPFIASYDLGYEYSQQHYIALQCLVDDADDEPTFAYAPHLEQVA